MESIWVIYKITGMCGRAYVGATKNGVRARWRQHQRDASYGVDTYLYRAMRKYGAGWFSVQILCECASKEEAKRAERAMITVHNTYANTGNGFNLTYGGDGNWGWKPSTETKARIGVKSAERMANNPDYSRKMVSGHTKDSRKRPGNRDRAISMGHAKKGIKLSEYQREKLRTASIGRVKTESEIAKLKAKRPKGIWKNPPEWTAKMKRTKRSDSLHREALRMRGEPARSALRKETARHG